MRYIYKINKISSAFCFLLLFFSFFTINTECSSIQRSSDSLKNLIPHESIYIDSDDDFDTYGFPGEGTEESPYRIEKYNITTFDNVGIHIIKTTKYFVIQNCFVNAYQRGIRINGTADHTVKIINNYCTGNNFNGILFISVNYSVIQDNICTYNLHEGSIGIYFSDHVTVSNNTCTKTRYGIYLFRTGHTILTYNLIMDNDRHGIFISSVGDYNIIHHNSFVDNNLEGECQACDNSLGSIWYEESTKEGNYWSESGKGAYEIEGTAKAIDKYPLNADLERASFPYYWLIVGAIIICSSFRKLVKHTK
jgi:parallel beta-helix repeat protein